MDNVNNKMNTSKNQDIVLKQFTRTHEALEYAASNPSRRMLFLPELIDAAVATGGIDGVNSWAREDLSDEGQEAVPNSELFISTPSLWVRGSLTGRDYNEHDAQWRGVYAHRPNYFSSVDENGRATNLVNVIIDTRKMRNHPSTTSREILPQKEFNRLAELDGEKDSYGNRLVYVVEGHNYNITGITVRRREITDKDTYQRNVPALEDPHLVAGVGGEKRLQQLLDVFGGEPASIGSFELGGFTIEYGVPENPNFLSICFKYPKEHNRTPGPIVGLSGFGNDAYFAFEELGTKDHGHTEE